MIAISMIAISMIAISMIDWVPIGLFPGLPRLYLGGTQPIGFR